MAGDELPMYIPFHKPFLTGMEMAYIEDAVSVKRSLAGGGYYTDKVNRLIESRFGARKSFLTTSCTTSLELAIRLLGIGPGDEVIMPSFTFVSTANAVVMAGARPVFADIREDTLNIDPEDIKRKISSHTKAIIPVHYAGVACDMGAIMDIAQDAGVRVVEDAAHGVNARYKDRFLGTIGDIGCYSFDGVKNYSCGEGGALLLNEAGADLAERLNILTSRGTDRSRFLRGEADKYTWVDVGSNYSPADVTAAFLLAQLENTDAIHRMRMAIYDAYMEALRPYEKEGLLRLPAVPDYARHNGHIFYVLFNDAPSRDREMAALGAAGVNAIFHYIPLHSSPMGKKMGYSGEGLPVTDRASERLLRLPIYAGMSRGELSYVISAFHRTMSRYTQEMLVKSV
jgi:dTDP-4-amino-4,6-dideoxygalactose transaminase